MFHQVLNQLEMDLLWTTGLVMMFAIFLLVLLYALTRTREQADRWARIPLAADEDERASAGREENPHD